MMASFGKLKMGISLKERDGDNLGIMKMGISLKEREWDNLGITKMGISLKEALPFLLHMVTFRDF